MKTELLKLPRLTDNPEYAAAQAKYMELQADLGATQKRYDAILDQLNGEDGTTDQKSSIVSAALRLIGRSDASTPAVSANTLRQELVTVGDALRILKEAVSIQKAFLTELRVKVSKKCIADLSPAHMGMVREIAKCVLALDAALAVEFDFRDELIQRDIIAGDLRWMPLPGFGRTKDSNSRVSAWLIEACEYGFLKINDIPECLHSWAKAKMAKPTSTTPTLRTQANIDGWVEA